MLSWHHRGLQASARDARPSVPTHLARKARSAGEELEAGRGWLV